MSRFYLVNEKRFPLQVEQGTNVDLLPYYRWEHRVTIGYNGKRYMVFLDNLKQNIYIEDITLGIEKIKDDSLWEAVFEFATQKGYLMMFPPLIKDSKERFV